LRVHGALLISVSLAPSQTPADASIPSNRVHGYMRRKVCHYASRLSVHQQTTNFSPKLLHTLTIYYIHFCHHCQPPLNPTALDGAHTHINSLDIQPIFRTVTFSPACCTKTPTRHYLSFLLCCVCMYMLGECFLMTVCCVLFV